MEHSDYQSLRIGGGNCAHVHTLAHVSELVVVVVCDGVKADSEVSEAGCDTARYTRLSLTSASPGTPPAMDWAVTQLLTLIEWDGTTTLPVTIADLRLACQDLLETCEI